MRRFREALQFTEDQLQEMERLYAEGYGTVTIAKVYGCLGGSVWKRLQARGVVMRTTKARSPAALCRHPGGYLVVNRRYEHRRIAAEKLGRPLKRGEVVHHINGIKDDNRPENLEVVASNADHLSAYHHPGVWTPGKDLRLVSLWRRGYTGRETAQMLGVSASSVDNRVRELRAAAILKRGEKPPRKTCKHGHAFSPDNTTVNTRGVRICRTCASHRNRAHRTRHARSS